MFDSPVETKAVANLQTKNKMSHHRYLPPLTISYHCFLDFFKALLHLKIFDRLLHTYLQAFTARRDFHILNWFIDFLSKGFLK